MKSLTFILLASLLISSTICGIPCQVNPIYADQDTAPYQYALEGETLVLPARSILTGGALTFNFDTKAPGVSFNSGNNQMTNGNTIPHVTQLMNMITPQDMNGNIHLAAVTKNDTNYVLSVLNTASPADLSGSWSSSDLNTISGLNFSDPNDTKTIDCFSLSAIMNQPNFYIVSCVVDSNSTNITNNLYVVNTTETTNVLVVSGEFPYFNGNSTPKQQISWPYSYNADLTYIFTTVPINQFNETVTNNAINVFLYNATNVTNPELTSVLTIDATLINATQTSMNISELQITQMEVYAEYVLIWDAQLDLIVVNFNANNNTISNFFNQQFNMTNQTIQGFTVNPQGTVGNVLGNIEMIISTNTTLYTYKFTGLNFTQFTMDALAEVTTDVVNIWANNHYIGVLYDNMALVYTKEADVNTTNIQAYTNQAIWAELYYNNYAIVVYQNYSIVSFQFTEPSFTFSYQFTTTAQQLVAIQGFAGIPGSGNCKFANLFTQYISAAPAAYPAQIAQLSPDLTSQEPIDLDAYYVGPDLQFTISNASNNSAVTPILQSAFSPIMPQNSIDQDIVWTAAAQDTNSDNFTLYQFNANGTYWWQNCNNTLTNGVANISCGTNNYVNTASNGKWLATQYTINYLASNNTICILSYNNQNECYPKYSTSLTNIIQFTGNGQCSFVLGYTTNENETSIQVNCFEGDANYTIDNNTFASWGLNNWSPKSIQPQGEFLFIMMNNYTAVLQYVDMFDNFVLSSQMSTPENAMMFLNNYTLTICASTGIWVYRTAALPSAPILQYTIQDADIDNWNFTQTTQWFMTPMGNLYTILANATANSNNTEYAIFRPYMPYVSSILAFNPTGYTTNDSVVFTPFSTPAADFLICQNPPMANDNKFGLNYVPYQQILRFAVNESRVDSIVVNTNFALQTNSFSQKQSNVDYKARIITPNFLTYLTINPQAIQNTLESQLDYTQNTGNQKIFLNNTELFSGNMLGYTIVCPDNNTSCEDNLAIQNMLQSEKFNFSMYWSQNPNNQTTGQVISFFQDWLSSDDLYLLVMSSNTTNSTQYTTMRLSASQLGQNQTVEFPATLNIDTTDYSVHCYEIWHAATNATGDFLGKNLYVTCNQVNQTNLTEMHTRLYQISYIQVNHTNGTNATEARRFLDTPKEDNITKEWVTYEAILSANNTFGYASDFVIYTDPQNNTQVHLTCIEPNNGASSYDTYDITNISNANQSIDTMYHETFGDFFPGAQATNILTEASSSIMSNGDVVTFVTAQSQNISFNSYIKQNETFAVGKQSVINLYQMSLTQNFVLNSDSVFQFAYFLGQAVDNCTNFILAVQDFPIYEFTFNYSAFALGETFLSYNASYKNYGNQTLIEVVPGGNNFDYFVGTYSDGQNISFALWEHNPNTINEIVSGFIAGTQATGGFFWVNQSSTSSNGNNYGIIYSATNDSEGAGWLQQNDQPYLMINQALNGNTNFGLGFQSAYVNPDQTNTTVSLEVKYIPDNSGGGGGGGSSDDDDKKFPTWAIIVICVVGGLIVLGALGYFCWRKKQQNSGAYQEISGLKEPMKA